MSVVLSVRDLTKKFPSGDHELTVLDSVSFDLHSGDTCAIVGPSGSGKTTLLGLSAGLDNPSSGTVSLCGHLLSGLSEDDRAAVRNEHVGFIFQTFRLIPTLTALENVMVPAELRGRKGVQGQAMEMLAAVGLEDRVHHYPSQLSGGEQQRVGIARAFINKPEILFADEPTGNLDEDTGSAIEDLLFDLNATAGTTLVMVTHDLKLARKTGRVLRLKRGVVISESETAEQKRDGSADVTSNVV